MFDVMSGVYGAAAAWRRRWYTRETSRRRRLQRPVVSVGNLRVGGSGKTPVVEYLARLLVSNGARPAILTRGYRRRVALDGVTVVSDGRDILAGVDEAGDEPLMLARRLRGVPVLVGADRFLSGRLAERCFDATVHLLDDGFQHMALERDVDLLLVGPRDLDDVPLPAGRLREPIAAAAAADALLVVDTASDRAVVAGAAPDVGNDTVDARAMLCEALGVADAFDVHRLLGDPWWLTPRSGQAPVSHATPVFAVAAIADPDRFFRDLQAAGWNVKGVLGFRDHHRFVDADLERIGAAAIAAGAGAILTTEKDAARLEALDVGNLPFAVVPMAVLIEPADRFAEWLLRRITAADARRAHNS